MNTKTTAHQQLSQTAGEPGRHSRLWRSLRWGLALLLAGIAAWLSIRQIRWPVLRAALAESNLPLAGVALATVLATTVAKAARGYVLLERCNVQVSGLRVLRVLFIGQMGNSFLPARLGDVARSMLLGPQTSGGIPTVLGTILVEKTLDGLVGLLVLVGLALWTPLPAWLRSPVLGLAMLTGGLLVLLALAATRRRGSTLLPGRLIRWLPARVQALVGQVVAGLRLGLGLFSRPAWLVLVTGYAANFLPTLPAQVGVFEYACILAFGLLLHLLVYAPPTVLGSLSMAVEGLSWTGLKQAQGTYLEYGGFAP